MENQKQTNQTNPLSTIVDKIQRPPHSIFARGIGIITAALMLSGCSIREIKDPQSGAVIYRSRRLGNTEKFNAIVATYVTPNGTTNSIRIEGYASDQVEGVKAMFTGINDLLVKIAKSAAPIP